MKQAREEFHAQLAATRGQQQVQSSDLMDDNELLSDDRDLDVDLAGKFITSPQKSSISNIVCVFVLVQVL